jgi:hypothetical protein
MNKRTRAKHSPTQLRWILCASGLWLMLSPILLLSREMISSGAAATETGTLMIAGVLALGFVGFVDREPVHWQIAFGLVLGVALTTAPSVVDFGTNALAIWNASLSGFLIIMAALIELSKR